MKKILFLLILFANIQLAFINDQWSLVIGTEVLAQHMYKEQGDVCSKGNYWYSHEDCEEMVCDYCGRYCYSQSELEAHRKVCKYRPYIEFEYDAAGNRTVRQLVKYYMGKKMVSENSPFKRPYIEFFIREEDFVIDERLYKEAIKQDNIA